MGRSMFLRYSFDEYTNLFYFSTNTWIYWTAYTLRDSMGDPPTEKPRRRFTTVNFNLEDNLSQHLGRFRSVEALARGFLLLTSLCTLGLSCDLRPKSVKTVVGFSKTVTHALGFTKNTLNFNLLASTVQKYKC